jgi:methylglutaconyl-CoA hydratase
MLAFIPYHPMQPVMTINFQVDQSVATITLNRADKRNALTRSMLEQGNAIVSEIRKRDDVRLTLIESTGSVFCAGMDLGEMRDRANHRDAEAEYQIDSKLYRDWVAGILRLPMPTLVVMNGAALAGGVGLVLAGDIVVSTSDAFLSLPEPRRGIVAAMVTPLLIYRCGVSVASQLLLTGKNMSVIEAHQRGLIHEVVSAGDLASSVDKLKASILTGAPAALQITKKHLWHCAQTHLLSLLDDSMDISAEARKSDDAREGLLAFLEKREPRWGS